MTSRRLAYFFESPHREYAVALLVAAGLAFNLAYPGEPAARAFLFVAALAGSLPTAWGALESIFRRKIDIDTFNIFALGVSFGTGEIRSAAFIVLMLAFASLLDWRTASRTRGAVEELLRLKPARAIRLQNSARKNGADEAQEEIAVDDIRLGDMLLVENGARIAADGVVSFGHGLVNEASVTGESVPVPKTVGDHLLAGTLDESGVMKMRVTRAGKDATLERMAALIREAQKNKSRSERLADRFAAIFLPVVVAAGAITYVLTKDAVMTAALFLVACADDMAVAIPLAITASIGQAAKRGVVVKGGEWMDTLGRIDTLVLDKTGTLTYGAFAFRDAALAQGVMEEEFWRAVGIAEKFSEHPVGRALFKEAARRVKDIPDPEDTKLYKGSGITARAGKNEIAVGDESLFGDLHIALSKDTVAELAEKRAEFPGTTVMVAIDQKFVGTVSVADVPRAEARESMRAMRAEGIRKIFMFTGDNEKIAEGVSRELGLDGFRAGMLPEDKLRELSKLAAAGKVAMVGDGVNDAPSLARADVGIAMGAGGAAVAVESADVVILTDNLSRIAEMVALGRRTTSVIRWDMVIWVVSNAIGFALVLTGFAGPAIAAFYNFATDFLPLINSVRLFAGGPKK